MNLKALGERLGRKGLISLGVVVLALVVLGTLPFWLDVDTSYIGYYLFITCVYLTVAQGWNLVAGYTGQISLGTHAFFGLGAYTMAGLWLNGIGLYFFFDVSLMIVAGIAPAILATLIGLLLLSRLKGDYLSFGTLGLAQIVYVLFVKGGKITGGANGIYLDASYFSTMRVYYWVALLVAVLSTVAVWLLTRSSFGLALKAIREDDISAASHGINVLKYKVLAFVIGAFLTGLAGSIYGYYLFHLEPASVFNMNWLFYPILMVVLGGTGTIIGPVIGSLICSALFAYGDIYFGGYHPIFSGLLIILVMRFMPGGIMGLVSKMPALWQRKKGAVVTTPE
ncbi:MAG: branched-chain amino acid ABC transporter permease [Thermoleophilia bacterium]|nr:branched-chain amino acid ABC transporter permease [Thermoleophilia bacterium]